MDNKPQSISLFELNNRVKSGIRDLFPDAYWIVGEISEMNINQSGHCYLELIEKKPESEQIIARAKGTIWAFTFRMLRPYFESVTGQRFSTGLKVMLQVNIEFHELYGYSLNIKDIEPNYTIGDLSRKRQEIIKQLQDEGVFHLNQELDFPTVPQRIAVISSETAAGYGDFVNQLNNNRYGYAFKIKLFQAYMQGGEAEQSIISALDRIFEGNEIFDVVVIIRGGGAQADLNCFNSYWLCYNITQFPTPIITGIGHERDETIADLVAHTSLKTPTAVAEYIINHTLEFDTYLDELNSRTITVATEQLRTWKDETNRYSRSVTSLVKLRMNTEQQRINSFGTSSRQALRRYLLKNSQRLDAVSNRVKANLSHFFNHGRQNLALTQKNITLLVKSSLKDEHKRLERFETSNHLLDPSHILKRGYSLTFRNGTLIKSAATLTPGDVIETKWNDGSATSIVNQTNPTKASND
ncbi:MAG: exodeoxyribonuclease VII large subunit [Bacteroidota bacterium]|nr:exodeoxyribonuclease VII large subunit [Bacteroidota bacterium]